MLLKLNKFNLLILKFPDTIFLIKILNIKFLHEIYKNIIG